MFLFVEYENANGRSPSASRLALRQAGAAHKHELELMPVVSTSRICSRVRVSWEVNDMSKTPSHAKLKGPANLKSFVTNMSHDVC